MAGLRAAFAAFSGGLSHSSSSPSLSAPDRDLVLPPNQLKPDKDVPLEWSISSSPLATTPSCSLFSATHVESSQPCCLKIYKRETLTSTPSLLPCCRQESAVAVAFGLQPHPNVAMPLRVMETRSRVIVELDLVEGGDLYALISAGRKWGDKKQPGLVVAQVSSPLPLPPQPS